MFCRRLNFKKYRSGGRTSKILHRHTCSLGTSFYLKIVLAGLVEELSQLSRTTQLYSTKWYFILDKGSCNLKIRLKMVSALTFSQYFYAPWLAEMIDGSYLFWSNIGKGIRFRYFVYNQVVPLRSWQKMVKTWRRLPSGLWKTSGRLQKWSEVWQRKMYVHW